MWPKLIDMNQDECRKALRSLGEYEWRYAVYFVMIIHNDPRFNFPNDFLELEAYSNVIAVLRAQGALGPEKRKLLQDMAAALNIPIERHKAEVRKAVNDEKLNTIAEV